MDSSVNVTSILRKYAPDTDDAVVEYIKGYLDENSLDDEEDALTDFVRPLLLDSGAGGDAVDKICEQLAVIVVSYKSHRATKPQEGLRRLDRAIDMRSQSSISATARLTQGSVDLEAVSSGRAQKSLVDASKLAKAEAKIASKLAKRQAKSHTLAVEYEASKLIQQQAEAFADAYRTYNPILDYTTTKGKVKDIKIENFDISFAGKRILTNANLTLAFGRRYGVVGKNGIGKSTLLRAIARREVAVPAHISILYVEQEVYADDTTALDMVLKADVWRDTLLNEQMTLNAGMEVVELDLAKEDGLEEERKILEEKRDELAMRLKEVHTKLDEIESDKAESRASAILSGLGFSTEDQRKATKTFSGGWRMRIALARALFNKPDVLLLDEPDNMLDIPAIVWLENYMKKWPNTLVVVSHDREFLDEVATDILFQHSEKLDYYKGNWSQFNATKNERRKAQLREYETQMQYRQHLQDFIDRWRYNAKRASQAQSKIKILEKLPALEAPEEEKEVTFRFPELNDSLSPPILQMDNVNFGYDRSKIVIAGINMDMQLDSRIAIVGPNGAGKSTMLKVLVGQLQPISGLVNRHGRLRIAYFTQHHIDQLDLNLSAVTWMSQKWPGKTEEDYRRHLGSFGITGMVGLQQIMTLSGGQKSRVAFACLGLQNPHILILDEPTNHLDMESIEALTNAIKEYRGGVAIVSHDQRFMESIGVTDIVVCDGGTLTKFNGTIKDYKDMVAPKDLEL